MLNNFVAFYRCIRCHGHGCSRLFVLLVLVLMMPGTDNVHSNQQPEGQGHAAAANQSNQSGMRNQIKLTNTQNLKHSCRQKQSYRMSQLN